MTTPNLDLAGTRVFLTGGARGLGRGLAVALAEWGAAVAVYDRHSAGARETTGQIERSGGRAIAGQVDVTDEFSVGRAVDDTVNNLGGLDLAICNAGVLSVAPVVDMELTEWRRVLDVNATGTFLTARAVAKHMIEAGTAGSIVPVASVGGKLGTPMLAHYNASKFAVIGLTQVLAKELGPHGITVNAVCPGVVETEMIAQLAESRNEPLTEMLRKQIVQRPQTPAEIALAIAHLHLNRAITGQAVNVDGGTIFH